jgi:hypothetical protein
VGEKLRDYSWSQKFATGNRKLLSLPPHHHGNHRPFCSEWWTLMYLGPARVVQEATMSILGQTQRWFTSVLRCWDAFQQHSSRLLRSSGRTSQPVIWGPSS